MAADPDAIPEHVEAHVSDNQVSSLSPEQARRLVQELLLEGAITVSDAENAWAELDAGVAPILVLNAIRDKIIGG